MWVRVKKMWLRKKGERFEDATSLVLQMKAKVTNAGISRSWKDSRFFFRASRRQPTPWYSNLWSPGLDNNTFVLFGALEFWVVHNSSHWKYTHRKSLLLAHLSIQVMIRTFLLWASMIPWGSSQPCTIQERGCRQASYGRSRLPIFFILLIHLFWCGPLLGFGLSR